MPKFSTGQNQLEIRSAKWLDPIPLKKNEVVRMAVGTGDAAMYPLATSNLLWGVGNNKGTYNQQVDIATEGVVYCINGPTGTIAVGDPVIIENGTSGKVKSAFTTDTYVANANGTASIPLSNKAVPGSLRDPSIPDGELGDCYLSTAGTSIRTGRAHTGKGTYSYQIDQPSLGFARERATAPNQLFKVEISKQRYIKNNSTD